MKYDGWYLQGDEFYYFSEPTDNKENLEAAITDGFGLYDPMRISTYPKDSENYVIYKNNLNVFDYFLDIDDPTEEEKLAFELQFGIKYPPQHLIDRFN